MIAGNPLPEPPCTPFPDAPTSSDSEPEIGPVPSAASPDAGRPAVVPETSTADDISLLLTTSIEKPEPDPILGSTDASSPPRTKLAAAPALATFAMPSSASGSDPLGVDIGIKLAPSSDLTPKPRPSSETSNDEIDARPGDSARPSYSLPTLLLASYASAVTLALIWVLWTGRGLSRPGPGASPSGPTSGTAINWGKELPATRSHDSSLPPERVTGLGRPIVVGDLEVVPLVVLFREVRLYRLVDPEGERREAPACLILTLRLDNKSRERRLTPLELASVRDAGDPAEASFIETASGERVAMFKLAMESEWSIEDQEFPAIEPGGHEDITLVSEPVEESRLASPLLWRIKLKTGVGRSEEIGVRFARQEIGVPEP